MQFQYNADYSDALPAASPWEFPPAVPLGCARITTRILHGDVVKTVQNVLVRTMTTGRQQQRRRSVTYLQNMHEMEQLNLNDGEQDVDMNNSSSSSSSSSSTSSDGGGIINDYEPTDGPQQQQFERAYWIQRTVREAIYGRVLLATILVKNTPSATNNEAPAASTNNVGNAQWRVTNQFCAVKEMSWQHIRKERDRLAEDPIKEVSAMQFLREKVAFNFAPGGPSAGETDGVAASFGSMLQTNVMMPLDLLSDERHLYSIMPYCNGGELFELLEMNEKFTEPQARHWFHQVLNGIESLQHAGICHRDMSLENLLVHDSGALVIDLGMCLRIPTAESMATPATLPNPTVIAQDGALTHPDSARRQGRYLLSPQGICGKWLYMSPEIFSNATPFDGYAVDLWAAGVILFLMITGFPPWDRPCATDERFKYMTAGYLVQMLTEWETGLTPDAMDLLQRMLFLDPKDRLSLDQVRAHPWMAGPVELTR